MARRIKPAGALRRGGVAVLPSCAVPLDHLPSPPRGASPEERAAWRRFGAELVRAGILTSGDLATLELLACAYADMRQARAVLRAEGMTTMPAGGGVPRPRPEVMIARTSAVEVRRLLIELGITPASRGRVERHLPEDERPADPFAALDDVMAPADEPAIAEGADGTDDGDPSDEE